MFSPLPSPSSPGFRNQLIAEGGIERSRYIFPNLVRSNTGGWTLALAGQERCSPDYVLDRASYPYYVIELVAQGRGIVRLAGGPEQVLVAGSVFAYSPEMSCYMRPDPQSPLQRFFFALDGNDAPQRVASATLRLGVVRGLTTLAEARGVAEDVIREGQRHGRHTAAVCSKLFEIFLLKIAEAAEPARSGDDRSWASFLRCKALIDSETCTLRSLGDISHSTRLDPSSICRLFRRYQGSSPYQYLVRRKMALAAEFLIQSQGLVKEAATLVGFPDPYHFARCFKSVHGVPPSQVSALTRMTRRRG